MRASPQPRRRRGPVHAALIVASTLAGSPLAAQTPPDASPGPPGELIAQAHAWLLADSQPSTGTAPRRRGFRVRWDDRPSFRFGDAVRLDLIAKFQLESHQFSPAFDGQPDDWEFARKRVGVDGRIGSRIAFEFESELRRDDPVRDAFVEVRWLDALRVRGGRFKAPMALDELTSDSRQDFVHRSRMSDMLAMGRDEGGSILGRLFDRRLEYEVGIFRHDGSNAGFADNQQAGATTAARVTSQPFRRKGAKTMLGETSFGVSYSTGWVPSGLNGLRAVSVGDVDFFTPVYVKGRRERLGADAVWLPGPFSVKAEWLRASDQRLNQGLGDDDLSDVIGQGGYVSATWLLTGEKKTDTIEPRHDLVTGGGVGAWELAVRFETLDFSSADRTGPAFRNPRAEHILGNRYGAWTFGANWFLNRYGKVQFNAVRERFGDESRTPDPGRRVFWALVTRLQFTM